MKTIHGNVRQVRKLLSQGTAIIEVEVPVEHYKAVVQEIDGDDVILFNRENRGIDPAPYGLDLAMDDPSLAADLASSSSSSQAGVREGGESTKFAELRPSNQAGILCRDEEFQTFMVNRGKLFKGRPPNEEIARTALCTAMGISSRRELDDDTMPGLRAMWGALLNDFEGWKLGNRYE